MIRVCATHGCPAYIAAGSYCFTCRQERETRRGTRQQRGYDAEYDRAGNDPQYRDARYCLTCGCPFTSANPKTKGHSVALRNGGRGSRIIPQCRRCNFGWVRTGA